MNVIKVFLISFLINISLAQIRSAESFNEVYNLTGPQEANANATVTLIHSDNLVRNGSNYSYKANSLKDLGFCSDQLLIYQPAPGDCSGVLISENVILTAGHCVETDDQCRNSTHFIFDFENELVMSDNTEITKSPSILPRENVYKCVEILAQEFEGSSDVAFLRLDRKVEGRTPVRWRRSGEISRNESVYLISSPLGLPLKISEGLTTDVPRSEASPIMSTYAAVMGSSGGPVFNSEGHFLEGIHTATIIDSTKPNRPIADPSGCLRWPETDHRIDVSLSNGEIFKKYGRSRTNPVSNFMDELVRFGGKGTYPSGTDPIEDSKSSSETGVE